MSMIISNDLNQDACIAKRYPSVLPFKTKKMMNHILKEQCPGYYLMPYSLMFQCSLMCLIYQEARIKEFSLIKCFTPTCACREMYNL